jgi:hypothetical protein
VLTIECKKKPQKATQGDKDNTHGKKKEEKKKFKRDLKKH